MRTRHVVHGLAMLLLTSLAAPCFAAAPANEPGSFVSEVAQKALLSATNATLSSAERTRRLGGMLDEDFDVPQIARFVLGRYWQKATDAERQTFTAVFRDFMVHIYSRRFNQYNGESFRVVGQSPTTETGTIVYTEMNQPASGQPVKVEWRVVGSDGYRIIDISVAGISMALVQRDDFLSFLQQNGGDLSSLVRQLQSKTTALESK